MYTTTLTCPQPLHYYYSFLIPLQKIKKIPGMNILSQWHKSLGSSTHLLDLRAK